MTPDEVSKLTTPNSIHDATDEQLDERYNFAHGHLRETNEGLLRQSQASIRAILDEVSRRRGKKAWMLSLVSVGVAIIATIISAMTFLARLSSDAEIRALRDRVTRLESSTPQSTHSPQSKAQPPQTPNP
jgi:hypothetical protein